MLTEILPLPHPENVQHWEARSPLAGFDPDQIMSQYLAREIKDLTCLYNVAVAAGSSLNLDEIVWAIYRESGQLLDTANFAVATYEAQDDTLDFRLVFSQRRRTKTRAIKREVCQGVIKRVFDSQAPLLIKDMLKTNPLVGMDHGTAKRERMRSWLAVPIHNPVWVDEGAQGVIATWSDKPNAFSERELYLLSAIGTQVAIAIRNARLYESVLAERDRVIDTEEQARKELARKLHDGPTQMISTALMHLDVCEKMLERHPKRLGEELAKARNITRRTVDEIRTLLYELRPLVLETEGLVAAVRAFLKRRQKEIADRTEVSLSVRVFGPDGTFLIDEEKVKTALFAILQEAVNNAIKHAEAANIAVVLGETATDFYMMISDDGQGFETQDILIKSARQGSLGMINLHERAELIGANLRLKSSPGKGTRIVIRVPRAVEVRQKKRGSTGTLRPTFFKNTDAESRT